MDLTRDTIFVVSDHGQIDKGGHGGNEPITMQEPFVATGSGIIPGNYSEINMVDIAPTLAVLLGTSIPSSSQGRPLLEMVTITPDQAATILEKVNSQQSKLLSTYSAAIEMNPETPDSESIVSSTQLIMEKLRMGKLAQERVWRNMIALFFAIVPGYILYLRREKKFIWMLVGAFVSVAIFLLRFVVIDKNTFGPSWIPGQVEYITYVAQTTGIAVVLGWVVTMTCLNAFRHSSQQAARISLGFTWTILYILSIPILLNFSVNGVTANWTLPEFSTYFLGLFSLTFVLFVSVFGLVLLGISIFVTKMLERRYKR